MTLPRASSATRSMTLPRASSATRSMTLPRASSATRSMTLSRASSATRSMTLPRASSATRGPEETQGARGERGALVNMELLGLPNIGNTCFLNATLQCLLVLPSFSKAILHQEQLWSSSPFSNLLRCLSDVHRLSLPDSGANQTSKADLMWKVKYSLSGYDLKYLGDTQQDAHELLVNMLCQLKEEGMILKTLGVNYTCPVSQLEFQLVSVRTCTSCGRESSTREDYNHLSLDFSPERTLLSSLALTFKCAGSASEEVWRTWGVGEAGGSSFVSFGAEALHPLWGHGATPAQCQPTGPHQPGPQHPGVHPPDLRQPSLQPTWRGQIQRPLLFRAREREAPAHRA
ncbi:ubiquitin carboxyl-terminal hydrolase 37-like isoform X4 [Salvelinus alpinus]|uniref:ubiquitin carboxyl-terminal hydrolase 37-like isoform X4 n=1 Tax=Salvelinus alpinus TaxID=8036 RepID=UPI0039FD2E90